LISVKSEREIDLMRQAGIIIGTTHNALRDFIKPGVTTLQIDALAEKMIRDMGATPSFKGLYNFPNAACVSVNEELVHGIPSHRELKQGDVVSVDLGACVNGYHGDSAWSYAVGQVSEEVRRLLDVTKEALRQGLLQAKAGNRLGDICHAIGAYVNAQGMSVPSDYTGHGIGRAVHEDPNIPNYGTPGTGIKLKEGMTLAIEPMVHLGRPFTKTLANGFTVTPSDGSLTAHYEHTIVIRKEGFEILTKNWEDSYFG